MCGKEIVRMAEKIHGRVRQSCFMHLTAPSFSNCLHVWALQTAYYQYRQHYRLGAHPLPFMVCYKPFDSCFSFIHFFCVLLVIFFATESIYIYIYCRYIAYGQLARWCCGWLGREICVILPACAVQKIREIFPSGNYMI